MENQTNIDDSNSKPKVGQEENGNGKTLVVIMVGPPGSGKSTFCDLVMGTSSRPWVRICQDNINKGKSGTKTQCISNAVIALKEKKSVFIDRCNLDKEQRSEFVKLGNPEIDVHAVVLDLPAKLCISRSVKRTGHEGNLQGGKAAIAVNRMLKNKEFPNLSEGFTRITICQTETQVDDCIATYSKLSANDNLPLGFFGPKSSDTKAQPQPGILKFFKKVNPPISDSGSGKETQFHNEGPNAKSFGGPHNEGEKSDDRKDVDLIDHKAVTLAFPSISTADFQFDLEKASDIIIEKVEEYIDKLRNARLVLVDLSHKSKILSLVKDKADRKKINPEKFFTFVGDITCLYSKGGLHCNVIANAANWRLKPGGGGVNAAIFSSAGPSLEIATKERANSLYPGKALVVPISTNSPLFIREKVTHVIHVLGPNMNPQRPNYLKNNYDEGCKILREAYTSLFEGFASIIESIKVKGERDDNDKDTSCKNNLKRDGFCSEERIKRYKGLEYDVGQVKEDEEKPKRKTWKSWALALYNIAMNPEKHMKDVLEITTDVVVLNDAYPKAKKHVLVLARLDGLDCLGDLRRDHLQLLSIMQDVGMKWVDKFLTEDESLIFRLGFHSVPSMKQLHLHVISQDFHSHHLKNKKHWNSFNTEFFLDSVDVIEEVEKFGKASMQDEGILSKELRCHRCKSAHPTIPRLKSHVNDCRAPFPPALLEKGRLVQKPSKTDS